jgi:hypothetical protein
LSHDSSLTTLPRAGSSSIIVPTPRVWVPRHVARLITRLVVDYFICAVCLVAPARNAACRVTHYRLLRLAQARCRLPHLHRTYGRLGTLRDSSRGSSSTTSPGAGLSSTTTPTPHVRVPWYVARLVTRLVVDYFASRRLTVDYCAYAKHPGASARRAARHAARHAARRRLLRLA